MMNVITWYTSKTLEGLKHAVRWGGGSHYRRPSVRKITIKLTLMGTWGMGSKAKHRAHHIQAPNNYHNFVLLRWILSITMQSRRPVHVSNQTTSSVGPEKIRKKKLFPRISKSVPLQIPSPPNVTEVRDRTSNANGRLHKNQHNTINTCTILLSLTYQTRGEAYKPQLLYFSLSPTLGSSRHRVGCRYLSCLTRAVRLSCAKCLSGRAVLRIPIRMERLV